MSIQIIISIITSIIASVIVIVVQFLYHYFIRKKYEMHHLYEFQKMTIDDCSPPEYSRETSNTGDTKVEVKMPFDMQYVEILVNGNIVYQDKNVPANSPIYVLFYQNFESIGFELICYTNYFELRKYIYKMQYKYSGGLIDYALELESQKLKLWNYNGRKK